jgi:hypothetical protein
LTSTTAKSVACCPPWTSNTCSTARQCPSTRCVRASLCAVRAACARHAR